MYIFHGENTPQSRIAFTQLLTQLRADGQEIQRLEPKTLTVPQIQEALGTTSLFGSTQVLVIEGVHSLPVSKRKNELIEALGKAETPVVLWESRELTKTMLKAFPQAKVQNFPIPKLMFSWLDSLIGNPTPIQRKKMLELFLELVKTDDAEFCFAMLLRQVRLLLEVSETNGSGMSPFVAQKLIRQIKTFTQPQLLKIHHQLFEMEVHQKTSKTPFSLEQELALLLATM